MAFIAETVVGATLGAVASGRRLFPARSARSATVRHAAHSRRESCAAWGRTGTLHACAQEERRAGPDDHRQGPRRRVPADRRGAARTAHLRRVRRRLRRLPARPYLYGPPDGRGGGAGGSGGRSPRKSARKRRRDGGPLAPSAGRALRREPAIGEIRGRGLFRALEFVADRGEPGAVRSGLEAPRADQARGDGARSDGLSDGRNGRRPRKATTSSSPRRSS